jgi:hypothetical protein
MVSPTALSQLTAMYQDLRMDLPFRLAPPTAINLQRALKKLPTLLTQLATEEPAYKEIVADSLVQVAEAERIEGYQAYYLEHEKDYVLMNIQLDAILKRIVEPIPATEENNGAA